MKTLILRRLVFAVMTLLVTSILTFAATEILPGDASEAILGRDAAPEAIAALRKKLGLDQPAPIRYVRWLSGIASGDLGRSTSTNLPVSAIIQPRLWNSIWLAFYAAIVAIPLSLMLGLVSAANPDSLLDRTISSTSVFLVSIPDYIIALLLVGFLAVQLRLFPSIVFRPDWSDPLRAAHQMFLPMLTLVIALNTYMTRMLRAAMLDALASGYVEMALLKGNTKWPIIFRHALPNAIGPVLSVIALALGYLFSSVVIVEVIFSYPGIGRLMVDAVSARDIPLIQVTIAIFCMIYILFNTLADICLVALSPRLKERL